MKRKHHDPRTKLVIVSILSTLGLIYNTPIVLLGILGVSTVIAFAMGSDLKHTIIKLKKLIFVMFAIVFVQSVFTKNGNPIFSIGDYILITDYGIMKSLEFILRISIIIVSSVIITTSSSREIVQGLIQMRIPYEISFMVSIAVRFLPVFKEEMVDMIIAIQLRGVDLKRLRFKDKIKVYRYIFLPMVMNSILKARELSASMEMRGFRAYPERTSFRVLKMEISDYVIIGLSFVLSISLIIFMQ